MDAIYRWTLTVPTEALDGNGHVNNVVYVQWVQDVATLHADAVSCTRETEAVGAMWVVHEHRIRYLRPAFAGQRIEVRTWVESLRFAQSRRRTEIVRLEDGEVLTRGTTDYVFVDAATGQPRRIPPAVSGVFTLVPEE